ncbi:MAG: ATP-grasp domain-containing protein [Candidatus Bathyarchaeota archaeon]|nr:ATP-grasp domain-containing protein [Candidatus Bathyarchaeota archaeon]
MRILIYEHVSGGGYADQPTPPSLLCEGYAMLRGLTTDFKAAGHQVTVLLDSRLAAFNPPLQADKTSIVSSLDGFEQTIENALSSVEAAYVIAPESEGVLNYMTKRVTASGVLTLNCSSEGIVKASDKAAVAEKAKRLGLNFPKTIQLNPAESVEAKAEAVDASVGFPAVIKPVDGAGCSGLSGVQDVSELADALENVLADAGSSGVCAQEFVGGIPASVSLLCKKGQALPVSLNLQDLTLAPPDGVSSYNGGMVPFEFPLKQEAFAVAKRLVESFSGLQGYVGVDIVFTKDKVFVMEVNPRLTTSYVGLRKVSKLNIAQALIDAATDKQLPSNVELTGVCCFSKVPIARPILFAWQNFCAMESLVSPPFSLFGQEISYGLLLSCGTTAENALHKLHDEKEQLKRIWEKGQQLW